MFLTSVYRAKLVFCIILKTGFVARKLFLSSADSPTSVAGGTCATECICEAANRCSTTTDYSFNGNYFILPLDPQKENLKLVIKIFEIFFF